MLLIVFSDENILNDSIEWSLKSKGGDYITHHIKSVQQSKQAFFLEELCTQQ